MKLRWIASALLLLSSSLVAQTIHNSPDAALTLPTPDEVIALPADTLAKFEADVLGGARTPQIRLRQLVEFMFNEDGLGLEYDNQRTRTVSEAIADRKANCLSFTLTFMELARLAGFRTRMMESEQALVWFLQDRTLFLAGHVSAQVRLGRHRFEANFDPNAPLLRRNQQTVSDDRAMAHFYNNRAAELMAEQYIEPARAHFDIALKLDPTMVSTLNNQGVLYMREGDYETADRIYQHALMLEPENLSVLTNLINLRRAQNRLAEAGELEQQLQQTQRKNPLHHFIVGVHAEQQGDYAVALTHFQDASRLERREPMFVLAQERVQRALGNDKQADRLKRRADRLVESARRSVRNSGRRLSRG